MHEGNMNFFDNVNWSLTKLLLSCFGAWPFQTLQIRRIIRTAVLILVISIFIPEILRLITARNNTDLVVECATIFALHSLAITKMIQCLFNMKQIKKLLRIIEKDWQFDLTTSETHIMITHAERNRKIVNIYVYFIYSVTAMYMFTPMVPKILDYIVPLNESRPKLALYQTEYFVDSEKYEIPILLHGYIITPFPTTIIVAFDSLYANCVHHGCTMFIIVRHRLQSLRYYSHIRSGQRDLKVADDIQNHQMLVKCIQRHSEILEYARILESIYTNSMFFIVGINMLAMSITGLHTIVKIHEPSEVIRFGIYTIGQIVHLFFLSRPSQQLLDESGRMFESTYASKWYTLSPKLRRYYVIIMMRVSKPCKLTAGKFYIMSSESFGHVLKTSMSYCAVFLSMR